MTEKGFGTLKRAPISKTSVSQSIRRMMSRGCYAKSPGEKITSSRKALIR